MQKRKVLFIIDSLECGGAEKSIVSLLPLLSKDKYEIFLWVRNHKGLFMPLLTNDITLVDDPSYNLFEIMALKFGGFLYSLLFRLKRMMGNKEHRSETLWKCQGWAMKVPKGEYDVVIAYQQGIPTYLVATKIIGPKRLAWVNANIFNAGYNHTFNEKMYEQFDTICPVSEELHSILCDYYPRLMDKFITIYDVINPKIIRQQAEELIKEKDFNEKTAILTVGRFAPQKNHKLAVETARILRERGLDFCWYFIGEGDQLPIIEKLINKYHLGDFVKILGLRVNPYAYMKRCDIYVQTSSFEGFGLTIAEAKILGKPIVCTNFDVVHDQIIHEKNGLIAAMTPEALADSILRIYNDKELRLSIIGAVQKEENKTYISEVEKVERVIDESRYHNLS